MSTNQLNVNQRFSVKPLAGDRSRGAIGLKRDRNRAYMRAATGGARILPENK